MKNNFNDCVNRVLKDEGGYSNDPADSGGATNFGITQREVSQDVRTLTVDDAKSIYRNKYWNALNCDSLSSGVDYTVFDYGVNSGLGRPRKALQRFKSKVGVDLINAINNERTAFLQALAATRTKDQKFLRGWLARVKRVNAYSVDLANRKDNKTGPAAGGGTVAITVLISQFFHNHTTAIIIGGALLAIGVGVAVHLYQNKGKS
jgi:lysozyme family protein